MPWRRLLLTITMLTVCIIYVWSWKWKLNMFKYLNSLVCFLPRHRRVWICQQFSILSSSTASCLSWVPEKGTVGASGDLAPLSHLALGLIGEGKMWSPKSGWAEAKFVCILNFFFEKLNYYMKKFSLNRMLSVRSHIRKQLASRHLKCPYLRCTCLSACVYRFYCSSNLNCVI